MGWTTRPSVRSRALTSLIATCLLGALSATVAVTPASAADPKQGVGYKVTPGQPFGGHDQESDWLGSYVVNGKHVFCVSFQQKAPDTDEEYKPGDELLDKWGDKLPDDIAANISYLLLRYGGTQDNAEAAALAHLLHSWTAKPRSDADTDPTLPSNKIGYKIEDHLAKLKDQKPDAAAAVEKLTKDAEANRGPWTTAITPPKEDQHIGTAGEWTISVKNAKGKGVSGVPVALTPSNATVDSGESTKPASTSNTKAQKATTVKTGEDGTVTVKVTPTGDQPKLSSSLSAPADRPYVQFPVKTGVQNVVSTGGEKELKAQGVAVVSKPGKVQVTKVDAKTDKGVAGAVLRITAKDKTTAAVGHDGKPLNGADGKPAVVTTEGENGTVTVENLRAPQEICVVEVSAPPGYTNAFDPKNPPSACGEIKPGETLALKVANTPNEVPRTIPAGDRPVAMMQGTVENSASTAGILGVGALALLGSLMVGVAARRSSRR
ncbi:SpaA isopeptide-forming pilin-related protein [Amycolatopsis roodepoortensis]|uniref:SpaA isopeptide-forming pilin-related protein n=1 Tax=Amycolatopsis roodepoortensis TaxID=700274 RepID=UPI00214CDFC0|nr:SpaA isopeptide-forming pilin-related protein [Amycolatopsis roodepoortensis]UUV29250.1 SpaA isopeptide-forming pilin-related protein [Amycolatopsis roodepoortensis]